MARKKIQQSAQGRAFTLQKLKKSFITLISEGDQWHVIEESRRKEAEIQKRLTIAKESIKSKVQKSNSRENTIRKKSISSNQLFYARGFSKQNVDHTFYVTYMQ